MMMVMMRTVATMIVMMMMMMMAIMTMLVKVMKIMVGVYSIPRKRELHWNLRVSLIPYAASLLPKRLPWPFGR